MFSFLTDQGVYTPTRVLMGGSDSVAYCQATVQAMFDDILYRGLLIWLDDLLGYAESQEALLDLLTRVLRICHEKGLKLNPKKCSFYQTEARWCGRIISAAAVKHYPERIRALQSLPCPKMGKDLQQFVCAMKWMRLSIPGYNVQVRPLLELMEQVCKAARGRTKGKVAKVKLDDVGLTDAHSDCFETCEHMIGSAALLAHPDPTK